MTNGPLDLSGPIAEICKALGLYPGDVKSITISAPGGLTVVARAKLGRLDGGWATYTIPPSELKLAMRDNEIFQPRSPLDLMHDSDL